LAGERRKPFARSAWSGAIAALLGLLGCGMSLAAEVDFDRQAAPLLAKHCLACHRGVKAKAGLDLSTRQLTLQGSDGGAVVIPGKPQESLLVQRVANGSMPPENDGRALTAAEVEVLSRWIMGGAK
jgi:hypothetical protein